MSSDGKVASGLHTVSKMAYVLLAFALTTGAALATILASWVTGVRLEGYVSSGLVVVDVLLGTLGADAILRRLGLSRSGKTVEVRGRTTAFHAGGVDHGQVVEVRIPRPFLVKLGVVCLGLCLAFSLPLATAPRGALRDIRALAYLLVTVTGLGALNCFYEARWGKPNARADGVGMTGYTLGRRRRRRFVAWSDVATCEIETCYDTFGKPYLVELTLRGGDGRALLTPDLLYTSPVDQDRLVKFIKARLPKTKVDVWE